MIYKIKHFSNKYIFTAWVLLIAIAIFLVYSLYTLHIPDDEFSQKVNQYHLMEWDWVAIVISSLSLVIALLTFHSQKNTENNTTQLSEEGQRLLLIDYLRHFYCNHVVLLTLEKLMNGRFDTHYPSEEHLLKLKVDQDAIHLEAFNRDATRYGQMHKLLLMLRNYNIDVDIAVAHLTDPTLDKNFKLRDFNTLITKTITLSQNIYDKMEIYWGGNFNNREIRRSIVAEATGREKLDVAGLRFNQICDKLEAKAAGIETIQDVLGYDRELIGPLVQSFHQRPSVLVRCYSLNILTMIGNDGSFNGEGSPQAAVIPFH